MALTNPIPVVEWMPLDGLVQQWAAFVSCSTREYAFTAARFAFGALEEETAARSMEGGTQQTPWPETPPQSALVVALDHLTHAASSWLSACEWLEQYRTTDLPSEEEQSDYVVLELLADSYQHLLSVACLSVRLIQHLHTLLDAPVRVLIGHLDGSEPEVRP